MRDQSNSAPDDVLVSGKGMNRAQQAAMEVAESARDQQDGSSAFASQLLLGHFEPSALDPFPVR